MKKVYSLIVVLAAAAMVSCAGNANKNAAVETEATETVTEVVAEPAAACDSTKCCCEECDSTKCEKAEGACCQKAEGDCCQK